MCYLSSAHFSGEKMCGQWVRIDSFSSFLIYMLLCFQLRDGKVKEIFLPLHKCVFEASGNSGVREKSNRACKRKEIFKCFFFLHQFCEIFFVQTSGIISAEKKQDWNFFFPSFPCCFPFTLNRYTRQSSAADTELPSQQNLLYLQSCRWSCSTYKNLVQSRVPRVLVG